LVSTLSPPRARTRRGFTPTLSHPAYPTLVAVKYPGNRRSCIQLTRGAEVGRKFDPATLTSVAYVLLQTAGLALAPRVRQNRRMTAHTNSSCGAGRDACQELALTRETAYRPMLSADEPFISTGHSLDSAMASSWQLWQVKNLPQHGALTCGHSGQHRPATDASTKVRPRRPVRGEASAGNTPYMLGSNACSHGRAPRSHPAGAGPAF